MNGFINFPLADVSVSANGNYAAKMAKLTGKSSFQCCNLRLTEVRHDITRFPRGVPFGHLTKGRRNSSSTFVNEKHSCHIVVANIRRHTQTKQRKPIGCCAISCVNQANVTTIQFQHTTLPCWLVNEHHIANVILSIIWSTITTTTWSVKDTKPMTINSTSRVWQLK